MANNITPKLKAYVQIDGTGRVVSGTPVFRTSKPKSGRWREIPLYYRGDNPSSTTTTTTGGGVTPTAFIKSYWYNGTAACTDTAQGNLLFYSASTSLSVGVAIFTDAALTTPVTEGLVILDNMNRFVVSQNGTLDSLGCQFFPISQVQVNVCNGSAGNFNIAVGGTGSITDTTRIYGTFNDWGFGTGSTIFLGYSPGYLVSRQFTVVSPTVAVASGPMVACPTSNQISALGAFSPSNACSGTGTPVTLYYSGTLGNGTALYYDSGLTQAYNPGSFPSGNGNYLNMYFQAWTQVCTMSGNVIQSYTSC